MARYHRKRKSMRGGEDGTGPGTTQPETKGYTNGATNPNEDAANAGTADNDKLNDLIVSTFHMINVYNHQEPIHATPFDTGETTRISTFGILNIEKGEEKLFFSLDNIREKSYYYAINSKVLETDGKLLRRLTDNINKNVGKDARAGFQVHPTSYDQDYGYLIVNTEKTNN